MNSSNSSIRRSLIFGLLIAATSVFTLTACKTQQTQAGQENVNSSPSASAWKNGIKGTWVLQSVEKENFPSNFTVKTLFEEAPPECFIGSTWTLPANGKGSITFSAEGILCAPGAVRNIQWSVWAPKAGEGEPQFQFKKIYPGDKASQVLAGYRLELGYADENRVVMKMPIEMEGNIGKLVFNFAKY